MSHTAATVHFYDQEINFLGDLTKTQDALAADAEVGAAKEIENRFPKASKSSASDSEFSG